MNAEAANDVDPKYWLKPLHRYRYFTSLHGRHVDRSWVGVYCNICVVV